MHEMPSSEPLATSTFLLPETAQNSLGGPPPETRPERRFNVGMGRWDGPERIEEIEPETRAESAATPGGGSIDARRVDAGIDGGCGAVDDTGMDNWASKVGAEGKSDCLRPAGLAIPDRG